MLSSYVRTWFQVTDFKDVCSLFPVHFLCSLPSYTSSPPSHLWFGDPNKIFPVTCLHIQIYVSELYLHRDRKTRFRSRCSIMRWLLSCGLFSDTRLRNADCRWTSMKHQWNDNL
jgi:hypothetical protein